jgi:alkylhydroperoxidase/carboxymuconolactone decarboxylase family protein YurZ
MTNDLAKLTSDAFRVFMSEAPAQAQAWMSAVQGLAQANDLDAKTRALVYVAVLAALRLESGLPFHVTQARRSGASRSEVISAVLTGLPAAGMAVVAALPAVLGAFDTEGESA